MGVIDKATFLIAQSAHEAHQNTSKRISDKLESHRNQRLEFAETRAAIDERRLNTERMLDGKRQNSEGGWVECPYSDRERHEIPSNTTLNYELQRASADEKRLEGQMEVLRRETRASMSELTQAQDRSHRAKADAEGHSADQKEVSRSTRSLASSASGDSRAAEAQLTSREAACQQKAQASVRIAESTARIEEKIEEAHEHEHAAIDDAASGSFFGKLFGVIAAFASAILGVLTVGVTTLAGVLTTLGAAIGGYLGPTRIADTVAGNAEASDNAYAERALLDRTQEDLRLRQAEASATRNQQEVSETERSISNRRQTRNERRG